ncbi:hypothetical protein B0H13DRAFT_1874221 [Mycena leptocephala]|nr:hypothetical protein B0H13DRAFT_1874221 [Mycena leptocephala]
MFFSREVPDENGDGDGEEGFVPEPEIADPTPQSRRATVEEDDDDPRNFSRFVEPFPGEEPFLGHEKFKNVDSNISEEEGKLAQPGRSEPDGCGQTQSDAIPS